MDKMEDFSEELNLEERKKKVFNFFRNKQIWVFAILIIAIILGIYIRSLPMQDHGGNPGLWDITTNTWTLGPDLDPWLFTRYAKTIVENGFLPRIDTLRNVPLGFDTTTETTLLPHMIVWTYKILNSFGAAPNVEFAAVIFPVIMFAFTVIAFFLFVREIFVRESKESQIKSNIIALISTFFMIVVPSFLSRTVAGIPEKESAGFFFMFFALYLFLKGWKSKRLGTAITLSILSGVSAACLGLIWGGLLYVFIPIGGAGIIAFIFNKIGKKEFLIYLAWLFTSFTVITVFSNRFTFTGLLSSLSTAPAFIAVFIFAVHFILWNTKLSKINLLRKTKIPKNIFSIIVAFILILILSSLVFGPSFIIDQGISIHQKIFKPIQGRWNTTVAENRQPDFKEWVQNFGPFVKSIPLFFWMFFIGSIVLFKKMTNKIKKKESWILTGWFLFFLSGMIFSRYSSSGLFNGENFISKAFYYISAIVFAGYLVYYYIEYYKKGDERFKKIDYEFILLIALFLLTVFSARGAVRLVMVLAVVAPIFVGFLIEEICSKFLKTKDETKKWMFGVFAVLILIAGIFSFNYYYTNVKAQAYNFVPSYYNQQWQKAMEWVRNETPENAVFGHWWDYGYWVQSIGERATVVDGGNAITYWNYLMGRLVLTGNNQHDSLEFLYNHNATHLLIDSSDIGKYGAFSIIGSDENYDRYSWFGTFLIDETQTQETNNETIYFYRGGIALDEDLVIKEGEKEILLPSKSSGVGAIIVPIQNKNNQTNFEQPYAIIVSNNQQHKIDLRYLYVEDRMIDFGEGVEACAKIIPNVNTNSVNRLGAILFISERDLRGLFAQVYLLDDPFNNFPNFKLAHTEQNLIIESMNSQGLTMPDFVYYQGLQGPIKIWEIEYTGEEEIKEEYIDKNANKYLEWQL
ncbi:MAG: STT3 domain-containing protein [Candidatus Pacearchaeota archaeon]|jgi:asparagine N-glycosylation enzyme membrane subunit Stt3